MRIYLKFVAIRAARHVSEGREGVSSSLRMVPLDARDLRHDQFSKQSTMDLWPDRVAGELALGFLDPEAIKKIDAGTVLDVTIELPEEVG